MQVIALAGEKRMLFHVEHNVEVARRPARHTGLSVSTEANAGAVFDPRRNFGFHGALTQHAAFSFALKARIGDHAAQTLASRAGTRHREESLLIAHLPAALAGTAGDGSLSRCRTRA